MGERRNQAPKAEDAGGFQTTRWSLVLRAQVPLLPRLLATGFATACPHA
jgi:hypothetical protein